MSAFVFSSLLAASLVAPAPTQPVVATTTDAGVLIPADWASADFHAAAGGRGVRRAVAEEVQAQPVATGVYSGARRGDRYDTFAARFEEAAVPGCLRPDGLKHQPPKIGSIGVGGILALPFLVVAAVRGQCK